MEDYEKFVEFRLSQLKKPKDVDEDKPKSSSLICFYGRPILPPLLSESQRKEMCSLKKAAMQKAVENIKRKDDPRMSYVQTILHSVPIRNTPTLEELLKESDIDTRTTISDCINGSLSQNTFTEKSPCTHFKTTEMAKELPFTSTTCSALLTSHLPPPSTSYSEIRHEFFQETDADLDSNSLKTYCHQLSLGYISSTNVENTVSAIDSLKEDIFQSEEEDVENFFVHKLSDTVKKLPDICSYPPVDGEELERSGQESSFGMHLKTENPENTSFILPSSTEQSCDVYSEQTELKEISHLVTDDQNVVVKDDLTDLPKETPEPKCFVQIQTQLNEEVQTDEEDLKPSEEPYRMSLQALLKKSQEYRQRQRILRNQAKNAKIQDRAQDQPKSEEQSLSDKENDEQLTKETESRRSPERSDSRSSTVDQPLKISYESDKISDIDSQAQDYIMHPNIGSYDSVKINNWVNTSGSENISLPVPIWTTNMDKSSECSANTSPTALSKVKKYHNIPALNFCSSPFPCKVKSPSAQSDKNSRKGSAINTTMNNDKIDGSNSATLPLNVLESDVTSVLAKSSQHIDQLEFSLSGLKVLISDLESTLTENMDKSSSQSESQHTSISQNNSVCCLDDICLSQKSQSPHHIKSTNGKSSLMGTETAAVNAQQLAKTIITSKERDHRRLINAQNPKQPSSAKSTLSVAQRMRIPDVFRECLPETTRQSNISVLSDASNYMVKSYFDEGHGSRSTSLNQSYDVDTPSELWLHSVYRSQRGEEKQLTPESEGESQGVRSKVKRRLQMTDLEKRDEPTSRPKSSNPKAAARWHEGLDSVKERQEQLKQIHAAQIRALQEEHLQQQQELLQALAARYSLLQSMSLPCSMSTSRLGDTGTFPTLSQPASISLPEHHRHLLFAATKGFLTRRLLRTERVAQLVRTARDTQQFLGAFQKHSPNRGLPSRQDLMLQERVTLQLRAARYEIHDIFFGLSTKEKMQLIRTDQDLAREKELKRQNGCGDQQRRKSSLSAATQKSLERRRSLMIQKKTAERHRGAGMRTRHKPGFSAEQPLETRAGQYRANPQRVPKSTYTSRPR